ncbi:MAG: hypothetical protein Kapaf2KO_14940 [Candidatus Kapaibacteriales bacterium]
MKRINFILLMVMLMTINSCAETNPDKSNNNETLTMIDKISPFEAIENNGQYTIIAPIESDALFNRYYLFFEKHGYEGNGYCWEGHIIQILEKEDKELLNHFDFDSEAGAFYAYADSKEAQNRFVNLLGPIFSDLEKLEQYVKSADRSKIDD